MKPVNVWDYERLAEEKLDANAHAYFAGGAGDEVTLRDNVAAFERRKLRPRVLVDVETMLNRDDRARYRDRAAGLDRAARDAANGASRWRAGDRARGRCGRDDHVLVVRRDVRARRARQRSPLVPGLRLAHA